MENKLPYTLSALLFIIAGAGLVTLVNGDFGGPRTTETATELRAEQDAYPTATGAPQLQDHHPDKVVPTANGESGRLDPILHHQPTSVFPENDSELGAAVAPTESTAGLTDTPQDPASATATDTAADTIAAPATAIGADLPQDPGDATGATEPAATDLPQDPADATGATEPAAIDLPQDPADATGATAHGPTDANGNDINHSLKKLTPNQLVPKPLKLNGIIPQNFRLEVQPSEDDQQQQQQPQQPPPSDAD